MTKLEITVSLVTNLIKEQFPEWADLTIKPVEAGGHDNRTFRLGNERLVRMPSAAEYAQKVTKEQHWLPKLAPYLSLPIPMPIAIGKPSKDYPWNWSVYRWIEGTSANTQSLTDKNLQHIALQLANFLNELQKIDISDSPLLPGLHNFWRGSHPSVYDADARKYIIKLQDIIDAKAAASVWEKAISSKWNKIPVWIHGDLTSGNFLLKDGKLAAVIDFGGTAVGDPACDLVIAWTFLKKESREIFKRNLNLDSDTWARARGWALWKACFELTELKDKKILEASKHIQIISAVINEHKFGNE